MAGLRGEDDSTRALHLNPGNQTDVNTATLLDTYKRGADLKRSLRASIHRLQRERFATCGQK